MNNSRALDRTTYCVAALLVGLAFLLYYLTAARDIVVGDTPEFITAAVILGVPHPPGYPLFTMLGHLFSLLPLGPIPFRVNLLSAACGALTVGVIFLTAQHLSRDRLASALAAIFLAVTPVFGGGRSWRRCSLCTASSPVSSSIFWWCGGRSRNEPPVWFWPLL